MTRNGLLWKGRLIAKLSTIAWTYSYMYLLSMVTYPNMYEVGTVQHPASFKIEVPHLGSSQEGPRRNHGERT